MSNQNFFIEKVKNEKRRRTQIYTSLDYFLNETSYFDFFSIDTFNIIKKTKLLSSYFKKQIITSDFLLLSFFSQKNEMTQLLKDFHINEEIIGKIIGTKNIEYEQYTMMKELFYSGSNANDEKYMDENYNGFGFEINMIFKEAVKNAFSRFKTPIISSEILFITLMEDSTTRAAKLIKRIINNEADWYLLRYKIMKRIHNQESLIRSEVSINQQYFAYLLKLQLNDIQFDRLVGNQNLKLGVSLFRNTLISSILNQNFFKSLTKDIEKSIAFTNIREYSS